MQVDIRFVSKTEHKTLVTKIRPCVDLAEALRWAAECLVKSSPEDQARVTGIRVRILPDVPEPVSSSPMALV